MKAVRIHEHGGTNVLKWDDIAEPSPSTGQVLVEIKATSLNHLDIWVRNGIPGVPLPLITGSDASGIISAIGEGIDDSRLGERVMIQPLIYCGDCKACSAGKENLCESMGIMGENAQGVNAEKIVINSSQALPFPDHLDYKEAAAFALVAQTSFQMLINRANLQTSETVLIWGASSGVGSMAIQVAKAKHARVIAIAGTSEKCEKAKSLGADEIINYRNDNVLDKVKSFTNGRGADVVFEHVGETTWTQSMKSLARGGRIVTCGATTGFKGKINLTHLFFKQQSILGSTMGSKSAMDEAIKLLKTGEIKPVIDCIFPVIEIAKAHAHLASGEQFGKVVLSYD